MDQQGVRCEVHSNKAYPITHKLFHYEAHTSYALTHLHCLFRDRPHKILSLPENIVTSQPATYWLKKKDLSLFLMCMKVFHAYAPYVCLVSPKARGQLYIPWNWGFRRWWAVRWAMGTKLRSPSKAASALNHWFISLPQTFKAKQKPTNQKPKQNKTKTKNKEFTKELVTV